MNYIKKLAFLFVFCLLSNASAIAAEPLEQLGLYRWIAKGTRYGYVGNFPRYIMIANRATLDSVRKAIDIGTPSMIKTSAAAQFKAIFDSVKVDFNQESVALLLLVQMSGSNKVTTGEPTFDGDTLTVPIEVFYPQIGTCDVAYYVYALAVKKSVVKAVRLRVK